MLDFKVLKQLRFQLPNFSMNFTYTILIKIILKKPHIFVVIFKIHVGRLVDNLHSTGPEVSF